MLYKLQNKYIAYKRGMMMDCCFFIFAHMLTINGQSVDAAGKTVAEYLAEAGYNTVRIAVERNEEIVPKAKYAETVLADGDVVEVVNFVGGG
jgi:sulfur carrier protein